MELGLVFVHPTGTVQLGIFEHGTITEFNEISDYDGIYDNLPDNAFAVVEVIPEENGVVRLKDIKVLVFQHDPHWTIADMLEEASFPGPDMDIVFNDLYNKYGPKH